MRLKNWDYRELRERIAGRATAQLSQPRTARPSQTPPLPIRQRLKPHALPQQFEIGKAHLPRQRTTPTDRSVWRRIISQMRDIAPPIGKQNLPPKTLEMPILPRYFAFRDRN
jgi:hypothetical protein